MAKFVYGLLAAIILGSIGYYLYTNYSKAVKIVEYAGEEEILIVKYEGSSSRPPWSIVGDNTGKYLTQEYLVLEGLPTLEKIASLKSELYMIKGKTTGQLTEYNGEDYIGLGIGKPIKVFEGTSYEKSSNLELFFIGAAYENKK